MRIPDDRRLTDDIPEPEFTARGAVDAPVVLPLPIGPATGAEWELELPDGVSAAEETPAGVAGDAGSPTGAHLVVTASQPGSHRLVARLVQPWSGEALRTVVVRLTIE